MCSFCQTGCSFDGETRKDESTCTEVIKYKWGWAASDQEKKIKCHSGCYEHFAAADVVLHFMMDTSYTFCPVFIRCWCSLWCSWHTFTSLLDFVFLSHVNRVNRMKPQSEATWFLTSEQAPTRKSNFILTKKVSFKCPKCSHVLLWMFWKVGRVIAEMEPFEFGNTHAWHTAGQLPELVGGGWEALWWMIQLIVCQSAPDKWSCPQLCIPDCPRVHRSWMKTSQWFSLETDDSGTIVGSESNSQHFAG